MTISWIDPVEWARLVEQAGLAPGGRHEPVAEPPAPDLAGRMMEVEGLLDRTRDLAGVEGAFVCDAAGTPRVTSETDPREEALAVALMSLFATVRGVRGAPAQGMGILSLGGGRRLHLIEAGGEGGRLALGVVARRSLEDRELLDLQVRLGRLLAS